MNDTGSANVARGNGKFYSIDASTGEPFGEPFASNSLQDVESACAAAEAAFDDYRGTDRERRATFLDRIADEIFAIGEDLIFAAMRESGLPRARLEGERGRTVGQLRLFAEVVRGGDWLGLRIDPALPERQPTPRPDLRLRMIPLGPEAIFGASNFPLAFSTAGGDTTSALAAGCPVVMKGHGPSSYRRPDCRSHREGCLRLRPARGSLLASRRPRKRAGRRAGGVALARIAQQRPVPIPAYTEMSSVNPVLLLPEALKARGAELGKAFVASLTMGAGQFCTNPGLVLAIEGEGLEAFSAAAVAEVSASAAQTMLTSGIHAAYAKGTEALSSKAGVKMLASGQKDSGKGRQATFFETAAQNFLSDEGLQQEVFGRLP